MLIPFLAAVGLNVLIFVVLRISQSANPNLPERGSDIPGTIQPFLYVQDYWTMTWGNLIGLTLVDASFFRMLATGLVSGVEWIVLVAVAIVCALVFGKMNSRDEYKNDYAFPRPGEASGSAVVMLINFGVHVAIALLVVWNLFAHSLAGTPVMWFAAIGAVIYAACFAIDAMSGNFDPKRPIRT